MTLAALGPLTGACVGLENPDELEEVGESTAELSVTRTVFATQPWQSTALAVKPGDSVLAVWTSGLNRPWPGHAGFTGVGSQTTFWTGALSPVCSFGSLIYRIGGGPAFCYGSVQSNRSGLLELAFNDGVNFADNSGWWTVNVQIQRPRVGMPFTGWFGGRNGGQTADPQGHDVHDNVVAQWATDLYAHSNTEVRYYGAPWMSAFVSLVQNTPCTVDGVAHNVGKTVFVELYNNSNGLSHRIGRVMYSHLDAVPALSQTQPLAQGTLLGKTRWWPRVEECYDVGHEDQVHVHIELGTHPDADRNNNVACWVGTVGSQVPATAVIGFYGTTGLTAKQRCIIEP